MPIRTSPSDTSTSASDRRCRWWRRSPCPRLSGVTSPNRYDGFEGRVARGPAVFDIVIRLAFDDHPFVTPGARGGLPGTTLGAWSNEDAGFRFWLPPAPSGPPPLWDTAGPFPASATVRCGPGPAHAAPAALPALINPLRYPLDQLLMMKALARGARGASSTPPGRSSTARRTSSRPVRRRQDHAGPAAFSQRRLRAPQRRPDGGAAHRRTPAGLGTPGRRGARHRPQRRRAPRRPAVPATRRTPTGWRPCRPARRWSACSP